MNSFALRQWSGRMKQHLDAMQVSTSDRCTMQSHLAANNFPSTQLNGLRAALRAVEEQLDDLTMEVVGAAEMDEQDCSCNAA